QGQLYDAETGLYYNRHRYYDAESGQYLSPDPIGLLGGNRPQAYVSNPLEFCDPFGLAKAGCPDKALKEIHEKMKRNGKEVSVTVGSKEEAEDVLRGYISDRDVSKQGGFRNTTDQKLPSGKKSDSGSDWLPGGRGAYEKQGTYHYDLADANAKAGDHALLGDHLQIHTYEGKIIRIFY
ncbi:RHS repeat-associated core domain-containing protein, partial [Pectobacterium odoriferum]|uniref:RHS repeat-associated core domain-containing protein n=1 Tax=Pectobacterium odoriferum TaxID=78398 RepID=UPI0027E570DB